MKSASIKDNDAKKAILKLLHNDGAYLVYVEDDMLNEFRNELHIQDIRRYIAELKKESLLQECAGPEGENAIELTHLALQMFNKHGDYLSYLRALEKQKQKVDQPARDAAKAKKWAGAASLLLVVLTAVGIIVSWRYGRDIERLQQDQSKVAKELLELRQSIQNPPLKKEQRPDSAKVQ